MITNALHFRETIASASALLFLGQLPTSGAYKLFFFQIRILKYYFFQILPWQNIMLEACN